MLKRKKLGQNFLKNKKFLKLISQELEIKPEDIVVEIGGGHGELTQYLLSAKKLIVYEIDKSLAKKLQERFPRAEVRNENFLKTNLEVFQHQYKLVGNIPYSITGLILRKVFDLKNYPQIFVLTLQEEVAKKILTPGEFLYNWIKIWGEAKKVAFVKRQNFSPPPEVDSMILKIKFYQKPLTSEPEKFIKFLKKIYQQPKRMIKNKIRLPLQYKYLGNLRPHQLPFEKILEIFNLI